MKTKKTSNKTVIEAGEYLRQCREQTGQSQRQVALLLGYQTPQFVWAVENGNAAVPQKLMKDWAAIVNADKPHLLDLLSIEYYTMTSGFLGL